MLDYDGPSTSDTNVFIWELVLDAVFLPPLMFILSAVIMSITYVVKQKLTKQYFMLQYREHKVSGQSVQIFDVIACIELHSSCFTVRYHVCAISDIQV